MSDRQTKLVVAALGVFALACALIGCSAANNSEPLNAAGAAPTANQPSNEQPAAQSESPAAAHPFADWTTHSPLKATMRSMWVDCGLIIGNSYHPDVADLHMLEDVADDLARRAGGFAGYWQTIRDANRDSATAAKEGNWELATEKNALAHSTCGACHYEYWPWQARGFAPDTLKGWKDSQDVFGDEPWGSQVFSAPAPMRASMQKMAGLMLGAEAAIIDKNEVETLKLTGELHKPSEKQLEIWRGIERRALTIARLAREKKPEEVGEQYKAIAKACNDCHAEASDGRGLNPLPWPGE